jgi:hypothetical protein
MARERRLRFAFGVSPKALAQKDTTAQVVVLEGRRAVCAAEGAQRPRSRPARYAGRRAFTQRRGGVRSEMACRRDFLLQAQAAPSAPVLDTAGEFQLFLFDTRWL